MIFRLFSIRFFALGFLIGICSISHAELNDQELKIVLRSIGHEFLLEMGDSSSVILPIEKDSGRYVIKFEREFSYEPDLLIFTSFKVLEEQKIQDRFIVEVENCESKDIVHSFEV